MSDTKDILENISISLPDVWFDWYARFLPGCFGIGLHFLIVHEPLGGISTPIVFILLVSAYLIGHIVQPASSFITKMIDKYLDPDKKIQKRYAYGKYMATTTSQISMLNKISKAHAESTSMVSCCFIFAFVMWFNSRFDTFETVWFVASAVGIVYFGCMAYERASARKRKICDLPEVPEVKEPSSKTRRSE